MLTDSPPRKANRAKFLESDQIKTLDLPQDGRLLAIAQSIESAMRAGAPADVRRTCAEFLEAASEFYKVSDCGIRVLAARPLRVRENWSTELFGDYDPETMLIRLWMRTAVRKEITSYGTFLSTLCHEFCHHLDFQRLKFPDSWHTRGFYGRAAALYHHARRTPPKRLFWVAVAGGRWRIDWPRTNRGSDLGIKSPRCPIGFVGYERKCPVPPEPTKLSTDTGTQQEGSTGHRPFRFRL
jgi:hypothetical protein